MTDKKWCKHCNTVKPIEEFRPRSGYMCRRCENWIIAEQHSRTKHYNYQDGNDWQFLTQPWAG